MLLFRNLSGLRRTVLDLSGCVQTRTDTLIGNPRPSIDWLTAEFPAFTWKAEPLDAVLTWRFILNPMWSVEKVPLLPVCLWHIYLFCLYPVFFFIAFIFIFTVFNLYILCIKSWTWTLVDQVMILVFLPVPCVFIGSKFALAIGLHSLYKYKPQNRKWS